MLKLYLTDIQDKNTDEEYRIWDIVVDGIIVGTVQGFTNNNTYIERIYIDEEYRNQGYGTLALQKLSDMFNGIMVAPDNANAQRLYARIGRESRYEYADYLDNGFGVYDI